MELEHLLRESVGRYRALLDLQREVKEELKKARPDEIEALAGRMETLHRQAGEIDRDLLPLLRQQGKAAAAHPLFQKRKELLEMCAQHLGRLLPEAEAGKAVAAAELVQIGEGRTAMAGYGFGGRNRGKRVNGQV